jgi:hypothetical protein
MKRALVAALLVALAGTAWWVWPTDGRRIRARLSALVEAASVPAGEGDLQRVTRLAALSRGLAPDVVLEAGDGMLAIRGREAVVGLASRLGALSGPTLIELSRIEVTIDDTRGVATASALVTIRTGSDPTLQELDGDVVRVELSKATGEWLLTRAVPQEGPTK